MCGSLTHSEQILYSLVLLAFFSLNTFYLKVVAAMESRNGMGKKNEVVQSAALSDVSKSEISNLNSCAYNSIYHPTFLDNSGMASDISEAV